MDWPTASRDATRIPPALSDPPSEETGKERSQQARQQRRNVSQTAAYCHLWPWQGRESAKTSRCFSRTPRDLTSQNGGHPRCLFHLTSFARGKKMQWLLLSLTFWQSTYAVHLAIYTPESNKLVLDNLINWRKIAYFQFSSSFRNNLLRHQFPYTTDTEKIRNIGTLENHILSLKVFQK